LIVWIFIEAVGNEGLAWILAGLYLLSALMTKFITLEKEPVKAPVPMTP
jgi:hypothetical protein